MGLNSGSDEKSPLHRVQLLPLRRLVLQLVDECSTRHSPVIPASLTFVVSYSPSFTPLLLTFGFCRGFQHSSRAVLPMYPPIKMLTITPFFSQHIDRIKLTLPNLSLEHFWKEQKSKIKNYTTGEVLYQTLMGEFQI